MQDSFLTEFKYSSLSLRSKRELLKGSTRENGNIELSHDYISSIDNIVNAAYCSTRHICYIPQ